MAERFNLTAQLQLQAPTNTTQVVRDIKRQVSGIEADVKVKGDARSLAQINKEMQSIGKSTETASKGVNNLNRNLSEAARRFSVITVATGTMLAFARSIKDAVGEAIAFEREVIRISQVTGKTTNGLKDLTKEVTRLSTSLGVNASEILNVSRTLAQAGFSAQKTKQALDILAKTDLGATFENLQDTTEGAIAVLRQFRNEARAAGGDIKFLEQTMDAINSVSKNFAVESGDLITVIRRVGGVFEAAGGSVNELIALFTSVRATTRESAETISTGLRTIFTRIQRTDTVDQLKALGIELRNSQGQFVGAFEAVRRLSIGLSSLDPRDYRFSEIVEELGGFRQIGKVIPLIKQFTTAQDALNVAQSASGSVTADAATAQQSLAVQAGKVSQQFGELIRKFADSSTFKSVAKFTLDLAKAFIAVADALTPLLPLITTLIGLKLGRALAPGLGAVMGVTRKNSGGMVHGFNRGGFVPGSGNRDTVPAMLTPGEFVIRKSSVKKLGAERLAQMNGNRYASGGIVDFKSGFARSNLYKGKKKLSKPSGEPFEAGINQFTNLDTVEADITRREISVANTIKKAHNTNKKRLLAAKQFNAQKANPQVQGQMFEDLLRDAGTLGGSESKYGGSAPLDGTYGSRYGEVKRTPVSDNVLLDKRLRHEQRQNQLRNQTLTARGKDEISLTGVTEISPDAKSIPIAQFQSKKRKKFFGGLIQRFALGGIAKASRIGAAILDPDQNEQNVTKRVGPDAVKKYIGGSGTAKTRAQKGFGKVFAGKNYTLVSQGLNEKTSAGFKDALLSGAAQGIGDATASLSSDLGLGAASFTGDGKSQMAAYLGTRAIGEIYEAGVNMLTNRGAFKDSPADAPFDFPGGLSGQISDNFSKLPSSWIDAKSSYDAAKPAGMFNKVAMELADEYVRSGEYAKAATIKKRANKGGGISGSDTVPALLTPGEFVFSKSAAQSIGYSNLSKMNQRGVQGFNTGGVVGWKRFSNGGPSGKGMGLRTDVMGSSEFGKGIADFANVKEALEKIGVTAGRTAEEGARYAQIMADVRSELEGGASEAEAFDKVFAKIRNTSEENKKAVEAEAAVKEKARKAPTAGDTVAGDVQRYGGLVGDADASFVTDAAGQPGAKATIQAQENLMRQMDIEAAGIAKQIKANEEGVTSAEALTRARAIVRAQYAEVGEKIDKTQRAIAETNKARGKYRKALSGAARRVGGRIAGGAKAGVQRIKTTAKTFGAEAKSVQGVAQSAQNIAFFGTAAASAAIQMSSLSDTTKQAATETLGFATAILAGGSTAIDMLANLSEIGKNATDGVGALGNAGKIGALATNRGTVMQNANTAAKIRDTAITKADTAATGATIAAKNADTTATSASAGAEGVEAGADFTEATASMAAAGPLLILAAVVAGVVVAMKYFANKAKAEADALSKDRTKLIEDLAKGEGGVAARDQAKSTIETELDLRDQASTINSGAMGLGIGAGVGLVAGAVAAGTAFGSVVPVIGTVIGALAGLGVGLYLAMSVSEEEVASREKEIAAIHATIDGIHQMGQASKDFENELADIDLAKGLTGEQRVTRRLSAQEDASAGGFGKELADNFKELKSLAGRTGQTISELSEEDFEEGSAAFHQFKLSTQAITQAQDGLATATKEARQTLEEAANLEFSEGIANKTWEEVSTGTGLFAQALDAARQAIHEEAKARAEALEIEAQAMKDRANEIYNSSKREDEDLNAMAAAQQRARAKQEEATKIRERANQQEKDMIEGRKQQFDSMKEMAIAEQEAAASARALAERLRETEQFLAALNQVEFDLDARLKDQSNAIARAQGRRMDFSVPGVAGLDDITMVEDVKAFEQDLRLVLRDMPAHLQKQGQEFIKTITNTAKVFGEGRDRVTKQFAGKPEGNFGRDQALDVIRAAGIDPDKVPPDVLREMINQIIKRIADQDGITGEDFDAIFAPVQKEGEKASQAFDQMNAIRNKEIEGHAKYIEALSAQREKQLEAEQRSLKTQARGEELRAKARGKELSMATRNRRREQAAQANLRGTGVRAGDARGAAAERRAARKRLKLIQAEIKLDTTSVSRRKQLIEEQEKELQVIKQLTGELDRLTDQSEKASEIMSEIESEREKRETLTDILTDFVVGGPDQRRDMLAAGAGVRQAVATGTLQNQTPEQRALTVDLLDRLENIFIGTTGMTGKQVKQELVFRDAIRMGFDPAMAEMLATATSKEQQLIDALDKLTRVMEEAAGLQKKDADKPAGVLASGGLVQYRAGGGTIFKPRGTDTVPAMLTPGEFVIRKSAVDKIGANNLQALNNGQAGGVLTKAAGGAVRGGPVQYRAVGGGIYGADAINSVARNQLGRFASWGDFAGFMKMTPGAKRGASIADVYPGIYEQMLIEWAAGVLNPFDYPINAGMAYTAYGDVLDGLKKSANASQYVFKSFNFRPAMRKPRKRPGAMHSMTKYVHAVADVMELRQKDLEGLSGLAGGQGATNSATLTMMRKDKSGRAPGGGFGNAPNIAGAINKSPKKGQAGSRFDTMFGTALFRLATGGRWSPGLPIQDVMEYAANPYHMWLGDKIDDYRVQGDAMFDDAADYATKKRLVPLNIRTSPGPNNYQWGGLVTQQQISNTLTKLVDFYTEKMIAHQKQFGELGPNFYPTPDKAFEKYIALGGYGALDRDSRFALFNNYQKNVHPEFLASLQLAQNAIKARANWGRSTTTADLGGMSALTEGSFGNTYSIEPGKKSDALDSIKMGILQRQISRFKLLNQLVGPDWMDQKDFLAIAQSAANWDDRQEDEILKLLTEGTTRTNLESERFDEFPLGGSYKSSFHELDGAMYTSTELYQRLKEMITAGAYGGSIDSIKNQLQFGAFGKKPSFGVNFSRLKVSDRLQMNPGLVDSVVKSNELSATDPIAPTTIGHPGAFEQEEAARKHLDSGLAPGEVKSNRRQDAALKAPQFIDIYSNAKNQRGEKYSKKNVLIFELKKDKNGNWWARYGTEDGGGGSIKVSELDSASQEAVLRQPAAISAIQADKANQRVSVADPVTGLTEKDKFELNKVQNNLETDPNWKNPYEAFAKKYQGKVAGVIASLYAKGLDDQGVGDQIAPRRMGVIMYSGFGKHDGLSRPTPEEILQNDPFANIKWRAIAATDQSRTVDSKWIGPPRSQADMSRRQQGYRNVAEPLSDTRPGETAQEANFRRSAHFRAAGGGISGVDSVPAMLTPGEFVMSPEAVARHGVGYMKQLNRGRVPGFRRGGLIGHGNVQYKQNGGFLSQAAGAILNLDPSAIQSVLETFNADFSSVLDGLMQPFVNVGNQLSSLVNAFSSMSMTHEFSGNLALSVNIGNKDAIIEAVRIGLEQPLANMITNLVDQSINELKDSSG